MNATDKTKAPTVLLIATFDTKAAEALYLKEKMESLGCGVLLMDTGILQESGQATDITRHQVAEAGGASIAGLIASQDKGRCISAMRDGACAHAGKLYAAGKFQGIIAIGGAQGTDIGTAAMRVLPFGVPKFMVSTVASGRATFGPFVGTKDIIMMHSVADIQGINSVTRRVFDNAAAAVCGMVVNAATGGDRPSSRVQVALSMLGTITQGAMRAIRLLSERGYDAIAFHQNGTGGIAMEDMIRDGIFKGVLDLNLHELGDSVVKGLHASIRDYRLEAAGALGIPQVVAPGSINYAVMGPVETLPPEMLKRKYIVHNSQLTLVRLSGEEIAKAAILAADRLNKAKGPTHVFIPLRGFSYPDHEGRAHWDPAVNEAFIRTLKSRLSSAIEYDELDWHINDDPFIDAVVNELVRLMNK
ncbi:MAG: Tm-1-like ATP-binding domain-containing protein [Deltaproteobacteria bacterium]|nr:Tm-1-like ATP-binding domain-containing protein [Deltaproteobacteria bacterium]